MAELNRRYVPTLGMLRALTDARGATEGDYDRCRRRGLIDTRDMPTLTGRHVIAAELRRLQALAGSQGGRRHG